MSYPDLDPKNGAKAAAFTSQFPAKPLRAFPDNGGAIEKDQLAALATSGGGGSTTLITAGEAV